MVDVVDGEIYSIEINETWDLIDFIRDENHIGVEWVNKSKLKEKGEVGRYKGILVEKGFPQHPRIDFGGKFAPIARMDILSAVLAIASQNK